jgi:hypothetical protein
VFIELDGTTTQADIDRLANDLSEQKLQIARAKAMLNGFGKQYRACAATSCGSIR